MRYELIDLTAIPVDGVETHNEILEYDTIEQAIQDVVDHNRDIWLLMYDHAPVHGVDFELRVLDHD